MPFLLSPLTVTWRARTSYRLIEGERNRSFALIGELDAAERRLLALFSTEWQKRGGDRRTINRAYSEYRKRLMRQLVLGTA